MHLVQVHWQPSALATCYKQLYQPKHALLKQCFFRVAQVVSGIISIFEVCCQSTFSMFSHALCSRFSHRAEHCFSDPMLDMRNARANTSKAQRRSMLIVCLKLSNHNTNYKTIERSLFQQCVFAMVELFVACHKSARLPIDLCHLAVLSHCY